MRPLLIAHRGDDINFPENTLAGFASAFQKGAAGIELDIHEQDGKLIVVHNYEYDQTKAFPTLNEVIDKFAEKGRLEIEIKSLDLGFLAPLKALLEAHSQADIELTTSVFGIIHHLRKAFPQLPIGIIFLDREFEPWMFPNFVNTKVLKMMQLMEGNISHLPSKVATAELVKILHSHNIKTHSHIPALPMAEQLSLYQDLQSRGVDQVTFSDIALAAEVSKL